MGDACDNCPETPNADQTDENHNGVGDLCDDDSASGAEEESGCSTLTARGTSLLGWMIIGLALIRRRAQRVAAAPPA
jgi:hypothetical protein